MQPVFGHDITDTPFLLTVLAIIVAFSIAVVIYIDLRWRADYLRIANDLARRGAQIVRARRRIFAPGRISNRSERFYLVDYISRAEKATQAYCRTSMFSGVYWHGGSLEESTDLAEVVRENADLRRKLNEIESKTAK